MTVPIVFLHPLGADRRFWDPVFPHLGAYPTVALDLPGHGDRATLPAGAGVEEFSEAVARSLVGRVHLVGMSLGGLVAQHLAASRPDQVASVVLVDTVPVYPEPMRRMWRDRAATARAGGLDALIDPMVAMWFTEDLAAARDPRISQACRTFGATDPEGYARSCDLLAAVDLTETVPGIRQPTFVVCGEDDAPPFRDAARWLAKATGSDTVYWLPGRHACAIEHPDRFAALLTGLLPD